MPDSTVEIPGGITQALLAALDQLNASIRGGLTNPDGSPSGSAVYMQLPIGVPIDPKQYANPWTPQSASGYAQQTNTGAFAAPAPTPAAGADAAAMTAAAQAAAVTAASQAGIALAAAYATSRRVDEMLMVTDKGVAKSWQDRSLSVEYNIALTGMQALPIPEPSDEIKKRIADAQQTLYLTDDKGNFTGYTPLYTSYRHNQKALADARSAYALAYSASLADANQAATWPVRSASYQNDITQAYNDFKDMGGQKIDDAINTLQSIGGSAVAALIAQARFLYDAYNVGLAGQIGAKIPWSYIDPVSWWDHTNKDFGTMEIDTESSQYSGSSSSNSNSFSHSFYRDTASSTSGSVGLDFGFVDISANASHSETEHNSAQDSNSSGSQHWQDQSSDAKVHFEYFLASIERPWFLGDLFTLDGWYLAGQKKFAISDGTIEGQMGDQGKSKLLPMIPKAFVVLRNVTVEASNWGAMGDAFQTAQSHADQHTDSSSNSYGGSVGYFGLGGSMQHSDSESNGAFGATTGATAGMSFSGNANHGKLTLNGSQIVGWIGQIQEAAPKQDDPGLDKKKDDVPATGAAATSTTPGATPATPVAPAATPALATADATPALATPAQP
jgi:hypothetical protein